MLIFQQENTFSSFIQSQLGDFFLLDTFSRVYAELGVFWPKHLIVENSKLAINLPMETMQHAINSNIKRRGKLLQIYPLNCGERYKNFSN
jgi:hypothetical protein